MTDINSTPRNRKFLQVSRPEEGPSPPRCGDVDVFEESTFKPRQGPKSVCISPFRRGKSTS